MACGDEGSGRYVPGRSQHVAALSQRAPVCVGSTRRTGLHGGPGSEPAFRPGLCVIRAKEPLLSGARPPPPPWKLQHLWASGSRTQVSSSFW